MGPESSRCARRPGALAIRATATQDDLCLAADAFLPIDAAAMHIDCHAFYKAANGVRQTAPCCPGYLLG